MTTAAAPRPARTPAARIGTTGWYLTGLQRFPAGPPCDHCNRSLHHLYDVTERATGRSMTVGRKCCKKVTGRTLDHAEAVGMLRAAQTGTRRQAGH